MGMNYYTSLAFHWLDNIPKPDGPAGVAGQDPRAHARAGREAVRPAATSSVGDPDDCVRAMQRWADIGVDQTDFSPTTNTLPTDVVVASMELFGREVIPQFDKDPCTRRRGIAPRRLVCPPSSRPDPGVTPRKHRRAGVLPHSACASVGRSASQLQLRGHVDRGRAAGGRADGPRLRGAAPHLWRARPADQPAGAASRGCRAWSR